MKFGIYSLGSSVLIDSRKYENYDGKTGIVLKVTKNGWHTVVVEGSKELKLRTNELTEIKSKKFKKPNFRRSIRKRNTPIKKSKFRKSIRKTPIEKSRLPFLLDLHEPSRQIKKKSKFRRSIRKRNKPIKKERLPFLLDLDEPEAEMSVAELEIPVKQNPTIWVGSWNIGDAITNLGGKLMEWMGEKPTDILVFGFQEVPFSRGPEILEILEGKLKLQNYLLVAHKTINTAKKLGKSSTFKKLSNFGIMLVVYSKILLDEKPIIKFMKLTSSGSKAKYFTTKGGISATVTVNKKQMNFICVHMPFSPKIKKINTAFTEIKQLIKPNVPTILFGDLNARSTLDRGYEKNVPCDPSEVITSEECTIYNEIYNELCPCGNDACKINREVVTTLLNTDSLLGKPVGTENNTVNTVGLNDFTETLVTFFPTYKVNTIKGCYDYFKEDDKSKKNRKKQPELVRQGKYRLPGYPDRILHTKGFEPTIGTYKSYPTMLGNDHLPISERFTFKSEEKDLILRLPIKKKSKFRKSIKKSEKPPTFLTTKPIYKKSSSVPPKFLTTKPIYKKSSSVPPKFLTTKPIYKTSSSRERPLLDIGSAEFDPKSIIYSFESSPNYITGNKSIKNLYIGDSRFYGHTDDGLVIDADLYKVSDYGLKEPKGSSIIFYWTDGPDKNKLKFNFDSKKEFDDFYSYVYHEVYPDGQEEYYV